MALTLAQAAKLSQTDLQRGVVETFLQESVILDRIPLKEIEGNAYAYNEEAALPGVEFRAVNSAYAESTGTFNQKTEALVILGGDADVDTFIAKTRSNLNDQRAEQDRMKVKAASMRFQDAFINGDVAVDANSFDGLKKRLTGSQVLDAGENGLAVIGASSADRHTFFDKLDELLAAVKGGAEVLYMNNLVKSWLRSAARREGFHSADRDEFGRLVDFYNGIPMLDLGETAAGERIIPQTEKQGAKEGTSSIYAVRYGSDEGDRAVTGLTNGGVDVRDLGELESKPAYRTRIEFFCGLAVFGPGAARLRGVFKA
jgi:hypothetical protein